MQDHKFSGVVFINEKQLLFKFKNNKLTLISTAINIIPLCLCGIVLDGEKEGNVYFKLSHPFETCETSWPHNITVDIDYFILGHDNRAENTGIRFTLPELNYFIASSSLVIRKDYDTDAPFLIERTSRKICKFDLQFRDKPIQVSFKITPEIQVNNAAKIKTETELEVSFAPTVDYGFIYDVYNLVMGFLSFVYNRRNLWFESCTIIGSYTQKIRENEREFPSTAQFFSVNHHQAPPENDEFIAKEKVGFRLYEKHIASLMQIVADDKLNYMNIHSSAMKRNLVDLTQYLNITSSFELYHRTFCPKDTSDSSDLLYEEIKQHVLDFADKQKGKRKEKAKRFANGIKNENSLGQRIEKTFCGYSANDKVWKSLVDVFPELTSQRCAELSYLANDWRNELAHAKRKEEPESDVIDAIRFVEQLNYSIILRAAGYTDKEILEIIKLMPKVSRKLRTTEAAPL